jgi:hypothetical protein
MKDHRRNECMIVAAIDSKAKAVKVIGEQNVERLLKYMHPYQICAQAKRIERGTNRPETASL